MIERLLKKVETWVTRVFKIKAKEQPDYLGYRASKKQTKRQTGHGGSTRLLHHRYTVVRYISVNSVHCRDRKQCIYVGAEQGSTGAEQASGEAGAQATSTARLK